MDVLETQNGHNPEKKELSSIINSGSCCSKYFVQLPSINLSIKSPQAGNPSVNIITLLDSIQCVTGYLRILYLQAN